MSFPPGTEMFQFPGLPPDPMYSGQDLLAEGFPHSDIRGSTIARISPRLFAACHVLHRLLAPRHPPNALLSLHIHTTARAQGQNTTHATTSLGRQRPHHPPGAVKACPGRCASLAHTTTHHLHHVKEHARPARGPAPSRGSRTTPHGRVSEVSPPQRAAHQAFSTASLRQPGTAEFLSRLRHERKWRRSDSNRRPPACKAGALPLSYAPAGEDRQQLHPYRTERHHSRDTAPRRSASRVASLSLRGTTLLRSKNVVGQGGLEPPTPRLSSVCSNQLSYWPRYPRGRPIRGRMRGRRPPWLSPRPGTPARPVICRQSGFR